jgi:hypothetical protein
MTYYITVDHPYANMSIHSTSSSEVDLRSVSSSSQPSFIEITYDTDWEDWENDEPEHIVDRIYMDDIDFIDEPKRHGHYYIANAFCYGMYYLLGICISPRVFFHYQYQDVVQYMYEYIIHYKWNAIPKRSIDIIQLYIVNNSYRAVIKTYWLRLIQRHWKRAYAERKRVINLRQTIRNIMYRQVHGRHLYGANYMPSLNGLLAAYK